ncbi:MAG TPA: winged helix-turn-helix domain-containing tetratricopeptide repeat protein [Pseudolabrys sp.]|nr:winged helix-turn-helix domain-containing tetratricopeptide repeat protein [Pseudolabrys sp.]
MGKREKNLLYSFNSYALDTDTRELKRGAKQIALEPQVFDLLVFLIENRDRVVSKDDMIASVWKGRIVSESTLTSRINAARKAIGDSGTQQNLIRTVARKGLRFIGTLREQQAAPAPMTQSFPLPDRPAIAVLPFTNMSGDPEQEYFSDGISEDIITALSKLRWFFVIARNSSFIYKGKSVHLKQIADELGVRYVIEGSVRKGGDQVRITAQLNDVVTGSHLWAERYDRSLADVFAVQDEITEAIVAAIEPQLYAAENFRAQRKAPDSMDAWDLVMRALSHYWRITKQDNVVAQALLEKAIRIDPNYGQAYGLLAASYTFTAHMGWADVPANAEQSALAAIRADSEDPWAHYALGSVCLLSRRHDDALAEFELALRLNPNFATAQGYYGLSLAYIGRWKEGAEAAGRALRLSPRDPFTAVYYGIDSYCQYVGRNYEEAMKSAREALRQRADFVGAHRVLTAAAAMCGQKEVAQQALQDSRRVQPNISLAWLKENLPIRDDAERAHYIEGFRKAGLR